MKKAVYVPGPELSAPAAKPKIIPARPPSRNKLVIAGLFTALPPLIFYSVLLRKAVNVPYFDDYYSILDFLNQSIQLKITSARASFFLTSQTGEFRLWLLHALTWLLFRLSGHIDLRVLDAIGNGFVLLLAILLWKMFLPNHKDLASRLALFVPVSWLLFQLQYWETLDWATSGLQHVPVLLFSLGTIYLLERGERWAFLCSMAFLILAVASDGNGLLTIPIGLLILAAGRSYQRAAAWLLASAGCIAAYAYRYKLVLTETDAHGSAFMGQHPEAHHSAFSALLRLRPAYLLSFIGSAGRFPFQQGSLVLGILLCVLFVYMASRGYIRRNPTVSYCILFLLLTAIGVSCLRSDLGVSQSLSSRYAIYSALFLIFAWFAIVEEFLQHRRESLQDSGIFLGAMAAAVLFSLCMDLAGANGLDARNRTLENAMAEFEHPTNPASALSPAPLAPLPGPPGNDFNTQARDIVIQSMNLGVYKPPPL